MDLVEEPPQSRALPRAPSAASLQRLFEILNIGAQLGRWNHIRDLALFGLLYDAGIRVGEAVSLEIDDLNLHYGTATIRGTKTGTDRVIVYDEETANDLRRWLKVRGTMDLPPGLRAVFVSRHWQRVGPLTPSGVRLALRRWCTRAGIPAINPHALRHAYAVHTLRNGGDLLDVQRQLGHRNLSTTQRYTQIVDAGRRLRHAQHSPRANLDRTAAEEKEST
jgi:site-specific recombinase XerD